MSQHEGKLLYKRDTKGKTRIWLMEIRADGKAHRTVSGLADGKQITTGWTECEPKNVGKANATTEVTQTAAEVDAKYEVNLDKGYVWDENDLDTVTIFKPMLAQKYSDFVKNPKKTLDFEAGVFSQPKLDGIRCIAKMVDGEVTLWTRTGKALVGVPHIAESLKPLFKTSEMVLDGELYNHELKDDFNQITSMVKKLKPTEDDLAKSKALVQYHIYDIFTPVAPDVGTYTRVMSIGIMMDTVFGKGLPHPHIKQVVTKQMRRESDIDAAYITYLDAGYEGQMVRTNMPYANTRSWSLMKRKEFIDGEFILVGFEEGKGNWAGHAKRVLFTMDPDLYFDEKLKGFDGEGNLTVFKGGVVGSMPVCKDLLENADDYIGGEITVNYFHPTPDGMPRFPRGTKFHKGKRDD